MDRWDGFGYVVAASIVVPFLPFLVSLLGRDLRYKGAALGSGFAALFLVEYEMLRLACWIAGWVFALLAVHARKQVQGDGSVRSGR
jgi:hypothetical protein